MHSLTHKLIGGEAVRLEPDVKHNGKFSLHLYAFFAERASPTVLLPQR
jgi:hypothetical protein